MTRGGFTLVEALVAIALFGVVAASVAGLWTGALRTAAVAAGIAERARALEPYTLPVLLAADPPAPCDEAAPDAAAPCLDARVRCELVPAGPAADGTVARELRCEGRGPLLRIDLRGPSGATGGVPTPLRAWARVGP